MQNSEGVLVKVDKETKEKMKKLNINWSEEIRCFINDRINKRKNQAIAVSLTDKIFNSQKKRGTDTTLVIRKFRDERHGPNRN